MSRYFLVFFEMLVLFIFVSPSVGLSQDKCGMIFFDSSFGLSLLGQNKSIELEGERYIIFGRYRSAAKVEKPPEKFFGKNGNNIIGNLELSSGKFWVGRLDPKEIESVNLILEPRLIEGRDEGHIMLAVRLKRPRKFYQQNDTKVTAFFQEFVLSINPQSIFKNGQKTPEETKLIRYRVFSKKEITRKYRKNPPYSDILSYDLAMTMWQKQMLIQLWFEQAGRKSESEIFDYLCNNCATNLHESFLGAAPPQTLIQRLVWKVSNIHALGGNEGLAFPKILSWRGLLERGEPQIFIEREFR